MNVGTARFWILTAGPSPVLLEPTNDPTKAATAASSPGLEVIDRGPINQWTGRPHPEDPRWRAIKAVESLERRRRVGLQVHRQMGLEELVEQDRGRAL